MSVLVLATSIIRSQKSRSLLAFITLLINKRICNTCISVLSKHLLFSELRWNRSLFSELVWNISGFSKSFLVASCSFHFGVTVEFSMVKDIGDPFLKWNIGEFPSHTGFPFSANILPPSLLLATGG